MTYVIPTTSDTTVDTFAVVPRDEIVRASDDLMAREAIRLVETEDIFSIDVAGMSWDVGAVVYEPADESLVPRGADGKRIGVFLLHGGAGDYRSMEERARLIASRFGYRVVSGTFPGRLNLDDESRQWPGDTVKPDGTVRTPLWKRGEYVTPDQYDVLQDESMRARYGRRTMAKAKPGTRFKDRLAASPIAMEVACKTAMERHFPEQEYSIYVHGHSTGGPLQFMMSQRVSNIEGVLAIENSSFGYINAAKHAWGGLQQRTDPFDELSIRTWRDIARYAGNEALVSEGADALKRLPWLMETVLDGWESARLQPQFKCEYLVTWNIVDSLVEAARHTAERLGLDETATAALIDRFVGLTRELPRSHGKAVSNVLFGISANSPDHKPQVYEDEILPRFAAMDPAPLVTVTRFGAGKHFYSETEDDLPLGIAPAVFSSWDAAIRGGYFLK